MKHYILFHNIIMMTATSVKNSVEGFTPDEIAVIRYRLKNELNEVFCCGQITHYQFDTLKALIDSIE